MYQLIRNQGDLQVSESSANELGKILERFAGEIAEEATTLAKEDGYGTIKARHITNALNR